MKRKGQTERSRAMAVACVALVAASEPLRAQEDPFKDVVAAVPPLSNTVARAQSAGVENLLLRREAYLLFGAGRDNDDDTRDRMARLSAGFEVQKRFSTATRTVASFDYQGRIVYRDHALGTLADPMARDASRWEYETHNAYLDVYNLFGEPGRFNLRAGYFYQPFGLNQQTDTHGTLLQLSNDRVFGAERDWQAGFYGALTEDLDYTVAYLAGSGPDHAFKGQAGMGAARIALNSEWLFKHGLEGGVSVAAGERVDEHAVMRSRSVHHATRGDPVVRTWRAGADLRKRIDSAVGPFTLTTELAAGEDEEDAVLSGLAQAGWLHPGRRWGADLQYQQFWQDVDHHGADNVIDERVSGVLTYYLRNDVGNANLHWVALGVERQTRLGDEPEDTVLMVQYYRYW